VFVSPALASNASAVAAVALTIAAAASALALAASALKTIREQNTGGEGNMLGG